MGAFEYQALDPAGRTRKGVANADTARQVRQQLRDSGLTPLSVVDVDQQAPQRGAPAKRRNRLSVTELAVVSRQFATLLGSGLTIEESLNALIEQSEGHEVKSTLTGIRAMIMEGRSLADALAVYPRSFPEIYHASVSAGEQSGRLDEVLERLADYTEARQGLQQRVGQALIYPTFLTVVAILIVSALVTYVVPKVVQVFVDTGQSLPILTRVLITISDFVQIYGPYLLAVAVVAAIAFILIFRRPRQQYHLHRLMLRMPLLRKFIRGVNTARMARTLAIMVGSGVPLLSAMRASAGVLSNRVLRRSMTTAANEVGEGASFSRALRRSGHFPPLLVQMVASGETSGRLDVMLEKAAIATERELESRIAVMVGLFEPIMILLMGGMVLVIVLAILLPILELNQLIS
ncbi:MAG: type II secretion system inner membrane protein GspF [Gammaproteobacteria bacterium]|nr:type II secretion system inner membrane protein GspF [Gammaproteobacteria bacterium]